MAQSILTEQAKITSADTDFTSNLRVSSLVNMIIQTAWHHADDLGFGMDFLHENGLVWMLSKMHIKFFSFPAWNQNVTLVTWPKGIRRLFYLRDFEVMDAKENPVAKVTSEWLIINREARRPKLYNPDHPIFNENSSKHALETLVPILATPKTNPVLFHEEVGYSDVDLNQHLTSTRYIDWMLNTFDLDFLEANSCKELVINFIREIPYKEKISLKRYQITSDHSYLFEFISPEKDKVLFRGQLSF